jgi:hypothetical protein
MPPRTKATSSPEPTAAWNPPSWLAWAALGVAGVVTLVVVWGCSAPALYSDETGILGPAYLIAHPSTTWMTVGDSYMPGTSVVLAPIWWFTSDPTTAYRAAIVVTALLSLAIAFPVARLAEALGLRRNAAIVVGAIIALAPGHAVYANWVWSEQAVSLAVAFAVWRGLVLARSRSVRNAVWFALPAAATFAAHGRAIAFAGVAGLALLALGRRAFRAAAAGVAVYVAGVGGAFGLLLWASNRLYGAQVRTGTTLDNLHDQNAAQLADAASSQAWYLAVAWAGLAVVGVWTLVAMARRGSDRTFARWALGAFGAAFVFVVAYVAGSQPEHLRVDLHVYGRYFDCFAATLAAVGLTALAKGLGTRTLLGVAGFSVLATASFLVFTVPRIPAGGWWEPSHLAGIAYLPSKALVATDQRDPWFAICLVLLLVVLVVLAAGRSGPLGIAVLFSYFALVTVFVDQGVVRPHEEGSRTTWTVPEALASIPTDIPLAVDRTFEPIPLYWVWYGYEAIPRTVLPYDPGRQQRPSDLVLGAVTWPEAVDAGALPMLSTWTGDGIVWVFPGVLQDELLDEGVIERITIAEQTD